MQRKNSATYGKFFFLRYIFTCNSFMLNVTQCITQKHQATKHRFYFSPIEQCTATHEQLMAVTVLFSSRPERGLVLVRKYRVNMGTPAYTLLRSAVEFRICVKLFSTVVLFHFLQNKVNDNYYWHNHCPVSDNLGPLVIEISSSCNSNGPTCDSNGHSSVHERDIQFTLLIQLYPMYGLYWLLQLC